VAPEGCQVEGEASAEGVLVTDERKLRIAGELHPGVILGFKLEHPITCLSSVEAVTILPLGYLTLSRND
jgi:hypothetical protein